MEIIKLQQASFRYGYNYICKDLDLSILKGKRYALIGPSGGGKTTLLKLCAGLLQPTTGERKTSYLNASMIFQEDRLFPWLTIHNNIKLACNKNVPTSTYEKSIELMREIHLNTNILNQYPHNLSGGMKQRISFIRAIIKEPDIIFLDEPFSALDFTLKSLIGTKLTNYLDDSSASMIFVTHDISEALKLCDNVAILSPITKKLEWMNDLPERHLRSDFFIKSYINEFTASPINTNLFLGDGHHV